MKRLLLLLLASFALCACGPREIGGVSASEPESGGASTAESLRYPVSGANSSQRMLYYMNKPEVMERTSEWTREYYLRRMGVGPSPESPAYREKPRQRSPFRE